MRAIVAGGSGYLGSRIVADLVTKGYEVLVLSRSVRREEVSAIGGPGSHSLAWDGKTLGNWGHFMDGADLVINLSGERVAGPSPAYRWTPKRKHLIESSRRDAGAALVAAIAASTKRPRLLVQASGIDYYAAGEDEATESSPSGSSYLSGVVRDFWEPSTAAVEALGLRRVVLRLGPVLGPGSPILGPLVLQHRLFVGGPLGSGRQWFPWVALDDVAAAIAFLIGREDLRGAFNLVSPGILRNHELSGALGKILGRPSFFPTPAFALRLAFGEMATTLLEGVKARPRALLESGYRFIQPDIGGVLESALG